jgi:hypothetical protein
MSALFEVRYHGRSSFREALRQFPFLRRYKQTTLPSLRYFFSPPAFYATPTRPSRTVSHSAGLAFERIGVPGAIHAYCVDVSMSLVPVSTLPRISFPVVYGDEISREIFKYGIATLIMTPRGYTFCYPNPSHPLNSPVNGLLEHCRLQDSVASSRSLVGTSTLHCSLI